MTIKVTKSEIAAMRANQRHHEALEELNKIIEDSAVPRAFLSRYIASIFFNVSNHDKAEAKEKIYKFIRNAEGVLEGEPIMVVPDEPAPSPSGSQKPVRRRVRPCSGCGGPGPYLSSERGRCAWCEAGVEFEQRPKDYVEYISGPKATG